LVVSGATIVYGNAPITIVFTCAPIAKAERINDVNNLLNIPVNLATSRIAQSSANAIVAIVCGIEPEIKLPARGRFYRVKKQTAVPCEDSLPSLLWLLSKSLKLREWAGVDSNH
jgi:hypothetical protein